MKSRFYDLQHIKAILIADYLHACGIEPAKRYNGYALYHAPYREDPNASLKVDFRQNLWHDYGTNQGGSIIDLVMRMQGCSAYEAMAHLAEEKATTLAPFPFHREARIEQKRKEQRPSNTRRILSISEELPLHLQRLLRRGLLCRSEVGISTLCRADFLGVYDGRRELVVTSRKNSRLFCEKVSTVFSAPSKCLFPITVAGEANNASLCIFEGFMDFLSLLTMKGKEFAPCLVLNSVSNLPRVIDYLHEKGIDAVRAFLDNDQAGRKALQTLRSAGINIEDMSRHYSRYKDLNEYHVAQCSQQQKKLISNRKITNYQLGESSLEIERRRMVRPVLVKHKVR